MQWLTATLAFATTMLFFAVVVSTLVEMIHRSFGLREKGLELMLESLFERVIKPRLDRLDPKPVVDAKRFAEIIMANRAVAVPEPTAVQRNNLSVAQAGFDAAKAAHDAALKAAISGQPDPQAENAAKALEAARIALDQAQEDVASTVDAAEQNPRRLSLLSRWLLSPTRASNVPVEIFTQKLADSRIIRTADEGLDEIIKDVSQKFVAFGTEASEHFRRRARLFSVILAFPVAFLFYVHPYDLARTFISDPELAKQVADHEISLIYPPETDDAVQGSGTKDKAAPSNSEGVGQKADAGDSIKEPADPAASQAAGGVEPASEPKPQDTADKEIEKLRSQVAGLKQQIEQWDDLGIPVGWPDTRNVPRCSDPNNDGDSQDAQSWLVGECAAEMPLIGGFAVRPNLRQAFWLIVGALLIGLGAPFWSQVVAALAASTGATQKIAAIVGGEDDAAATETVAVAAKKVTGKASAPTAVRTFRVSRDASQAVARTPPIGPATSGA